MNYPPCFDSQGELDGWVSHARYSNIVNPVEKFCYDCTPDFQAEMKACGRCIRPDTTFHYVLPISEEQLIDETSLCGLSPGAVKTLRRLGRLSDTPVKPPHDERFDEDKPIDPLEFLASFSMATNDSESVLQL